jgi:hypothetical protein
LKTTVKRWLRTAFELGQHFGLDVLPRHFYSEVPSIRELRADDAWKRPRTMAGVSGADPAAQFEFVESCCRDEVKAAICARSVIEEASQYNGEAGFSPIDADFLYAFVRSEQPRTIVAVGCGVSTAVMLLASDDARYRPEVVCIEPHPTPFLRRAHDTGRIRLVAEPAQRVPLEEFTRLRAGGLLFIDSTHTVKPGSEVNRLVLDVLPRLHDGVWVHFHDIYFPYDYQRGLLDDELFFCNESTLVHAFLIGNSAFTIRASLSMLHYASPERLRRSLPNYGPARNDHGLRASPGHFPSSLYLERV